MKNLFNRQQSFNTRFIFHETSDPRVDSIESTIRTRATQAELSDEDIHDLAHQFAEMIPDDMDFSTIFTETLGENLENDEIDTWINSIETRLREESRTEGEPSKVGVPITAEQFDEVFSEWDSEIVLPENVLPENLQADIRDLAIATIEGEGKTPEQLETEIQRFIDRERTSLRVQSFGVTRLDNGEIITKEDLQDPENAPESVADAIRRIIGEDFEPSAAVQTLIDEAEDLAEQADAAEGDEAIRLRAEAVAAARRAERARQENLSLETDVIAGLIAEGHGGFGQDDAGNAFPLTEDGIRDFYSQALAARNLSPDTPAAEVENPVARSIYESMTGPGSSVPNNAPESSEIRTLGDLLRWLIAFVNGDTDENGNIINQNGGSTPTDEWGRPMATSTPRGNTRSGEIVSNIEGDPNNISLNPEFYGEEMIAEYEALPESYRETVETITGERPPWTEGWALPVMRHAITAHRHGQPFDSNRPFFANDLGTFTALIYIPGEGTVYTTSVGGSGRNGGGGISNVDGSYGSPLGSFNFSPSDVAYLPNHRYRARATVHGFEPMREQFRVQREVGSNVDPSAGNTNTAGRAVLMHGVNPGAGSTWGCWGVPQDVAVRFAQAIEQHGGASGEAFVSTS